MSTPSHSPYGSPKHSLLDIPGFSNHLEAHTNDHPQKRMLNNNISSQPKQSNSLFSPDNKLTFSNFEKYDSNHLPHRTKLGMNRPENHVDLKKVHSANAMNFSEFEPTVFSPSSQIPYNGEGKNSISLCRSSSLRKDDQADHEPRMGFKHYHHPQGAQSSVNLSQPYTNVEVRPSETQQHTESRQQVKNIIKPPRQSSHLTPSTKRKQSLETPGQKPSNAILLKKNASSVDIRSLDHPTNDSRSCASIQQQSNAQQFNAIENPCSLTSHETLAEINARRVMIPTLSRRLSDESMSSSCYSSLPRKSHVNNSGGHYVPVDHYHALQGGNHQKSSLHKSEILYPFEDLSSKLKDAEHLLNDLVMTPDRSQFPVKPMDDSALTFMSHNRNISRFASMPDPLSPQLPLRGNLKLSSFTSPPHQQLGSECNSSQKSSGSSFSSFSQAAFFQYHTNNDTPGFQPHKFDNEAHTPYDEPSGFHDTNSYAHAPGRVGQGGVSKRVRLEAPGVTSYSGSRGFASGERSQGKPAHTECKFDVWLVKGE